MGAGVLNPALSSYSTIHLLVQQIEPFIVLGRELYQVSRDIFKPAKISGAGKVIEPGY